VSWWGCKPDPKLDLMTDTPSSRHFQLVAKVDRGNYNLWLTVITVETGTGVNTNAEGEEPHSGVETRD
jgi:hypothetical protein